MNQHRKYPVEINPVSDAEYRVSLPCKPDEFTNFIKSLLGKGLSLEKRLSITFDIDIIGVDNLHNLVLQRATQNKSQFISFSSKIYFDDDSSIQFNDPKDFFSYREVKKAISNKLFLEWEFFIHFPDHVSPEKQQVSVMFSADESISILRRQYKKTIEGAGTIQIAVVCTDRSWGHDMLNLIMNHIENYKQETNKTMYYASKASSSLGSISGLLLFGIGVAGILFTNNFIIKDYLVRVHNFSKFPASLQNISERIQFLVDLSTDTKRIGFAVSATIFAAIIAVIAIAFGSYVDDKFTYQEKSFLVLTDATKIARDKYRPTNVQELFKAIAQLFIAIFIGVLGNAIFTIIWSRM